MKLRKIKTKLNKKGSAFDMLIAFVFIFIIALVGGISIFLYSAFDTAWQANTVVNEASKDASGDYNILFNAVMDGAIIFYFLILWIIPVILAFNLDTNPIFFVIFIVVGLISMIVIGVLGYAADAFTNTDLSSAFDSMPMTVFLMQNILWFALIYFLTLGGALYYKLKQQ